MKRRARSETRERKMVHEVNHHEERVAFALGDFRAVSGLRLLGLLVIFQETSILTIHILFPDTP
jgi:hypothetical protein